MASNEVHVIDDDEGVRRALSFLLRSAGMEVRTHGSASEFLEIAASLPQACIVTDVRMPGVSGLELVRRLKSAQAPHSVIVITGHGDIALAVEAIKAGAVDFLEKPFEEAALMRAVRSALAKLDPAEENAAAREHFADMLSLSPRERDVLKMLVLGKSNKVIGRELGISARTVETYRGALMRKAGAGNLSELVRMAVNAGY